MDQNQARDLIVKWTRENFGRFLDVRETAALRRATGRVWAGQLYCTIKEGDIHVGQLMVDDVGKVVESIDNDRMIDVLVTARTQDAGFPADGGETDFGGFGDDSELDFSSVTGETKDDFGGLGDGDDELGGALEAMNPETMHAQVNEMIASGEQEQLQKARDMLPLLLSFQERRGAVLHQMAELEFLLGELEMGLRHLDAAAREYSDLGNFDGLSMVTELAAQLMPDDAFDSSSVKMLFEQTKRKLIPLGKIADAPLLIGLGDEEVFALQGLCNEVTVDPGTILLKEGDLANMAFILKSGTLGIKLEQMDGGTKTVRTCFPGDFIGESSVLGKYGATCTATVQAEMECELWQFNGQELRSLGEEYPEIKMHIESAKTLHQLDSFISMNESTETLDASMRDKLLACISGILQVPGGKVVNEAGDLPTVVHLIVNGKIAYKVDGQVVREYQADQFSGLRDTLHELPLEGEFVTVTNCLLVTFDPDGLRKIAESSPPEVIAVLEKLE